MKNVLAFLWRHKWMVAWIAFLILWNAADSAHTVRPEDRSISQIDTMIVEKQVREATFYDEQNLIKVKTDNGEFQATYTEDYATVLADELKTAGASYKVDGNDTPLWASLLVKLAPWVIVLAVVFVIWRVAKEVLKTTTDRVIGKTDFGAEKPKERFVDVDGAEEAIEKLDTLKDFLLHPAKYEGVTLERGVLLEGPTGTGKTLLAKAFAGESNAPFYHLSGSNLTSMWAGGTTQRIEKFFENIRSDVKSDDAFVVFIDEIDGIASKRAGVQGSDRDHNTSVTQLLHQVTSLFADYPRAILFSATNNYEILDPAVKRPGRFGLHIAMPNPDQKAREAILRRNSKGLDVDDSVSLPFVAKMTTGMSGASVASIPSSATILARRQRGNNAKIMPHNIEQAAMEVAGGTLRWSSEVRPEDQLLSAVHEAGHAVLAEKSPHHQLIVVTTVPIGASGGSTWCPPVEEMTLNEDSLLWRMAVSMGGRESEILHFGKSGSGPSHDIETATDLALDAVCHWGIFDDFLVKINTSKWDTHPRAAEIHAKVSELMERAKELAQKILSEEYAFRTALIDHLMENRIVHSDEIESLTDRLVVSSSR